MKKLVLTQLRVATKRTWKNTRCPLMSKFLTSGYDTDNVSMTQANVLMTQANVSMSQANVSMSQASV